MTLVLFSLVIKIIICFKKWKKKSLKI